MREVLTSKNVRLGRNYYIDDSNQDILKIEGIECFFKNEIEPHKLLVVVQPRDPKEEVDVSFQSQFLCLMFQPFSFLVFLVQKL